MDGSDGWTDGRFIGPAFGKAAPAFGKAAMVVIADMVAPAAPAACSEFNSPAVMPSNAKPPDHRVAMNDKEHALFCWLKLHQDVCKTYGMKSVHKDTRVGERPLDDAAGARHGGSQH